MLEEVEIFNFLVSDHLKVIGFHRKQLHKHKIIVRTLVIFSKIIMLLIFN